MNDGTALVVLTGVALLAFLAGGFSLPLAAGGALVVFVVGGLFVRG